LLWSEQRAQHLHVAGKMMKEVIKEHIQASTQKDYQP